MVLIEQAFFALPEVLVGSGYGKQEYEASIVSAFSLAILGELNGRNVANPMSCIQAERRFMPEYGNLRTDLCVELSSTLTGSRALADMGYRFDNWIEAKYFRGKAASTQNLAQVASDLVRLVALVPLDLAGQNRLRVGRFLLHTYLGDPMVFLAPRRKQRDAPDRAWVEPLLSPGRQQIDSLELDDESATFYKCLGRRLSTCTVELSLTNRVISPPPTTNQPFYTLVLSRLDSGRIAFERRSLTFHEDRTFQVEPEGEFEEFRQSIAAALKSDRASTADAVEQMEQEVGGLS